MVWIKGRQEKTPIGFQKRPSYFGGGLGAWAGGTHFRHKTQKKYFQLAWAIGVLIDAVIMYWMWK